MDAYIIEGGKKLSGEVTMSGAKNAALGIIAASILCSDVSKIENVPHITDIDIFLDILNKIGVKSEFKDNVLTLDTRNVNTFDCLKLSEDFNKLRASYYLLGALLGRFKQARVPKPGGCVLGERPMDQHMKGFGILGSDVEDKYADIILEADKLKGDHIFLDVPSVGATINIMLAATLAEGKTVISNAAQEPHIIDVSNFLNLMGAKIRGAGTSTITIEGVSPESLHGCSYSVIPDQIATGTYMIAAAATNGDVTIKNAIPKHMESLTEKLIEMGVKVETDGDEIHVVGGEGPIKGVKIETQPYPGFPTDLQQPLGALMTIAQGNSIIEENLFEDRFRYITELKKMGAQANVFDRTCLINGISELHPARVETPDLRGGAALVIAALSADGTSEITNIELIDRGYEHFDKNLRKLGADIKRVEI